MIELLKVLQPGDKTNIKSPENGKKLFFAGYDHFFTAGGVSCVFLAYNLENKNTFARYTEKALNKYGYTSIKKGGVYMKNRDFIINGIKYHLNDNIYKNEFKGKYKLLFFSEGWQRWQQIGTFDTKKAAIEYVKENYLYI